MDERIVLAMETSTSVGTVAVAVGPTVVARAELGDQGTHASRLIPAVAEALEVAGVDRTEVEALVVGAGPGSFTGVRVAAATAKGFAHVLEIPLFVFSSLAAGAVAVDAMSGVDVPESATKYILFDARSDRVYAACYLTTSESFETLVPPNATTIDAVLSGAVPDAVFAGDGALRHAEQIESEGFAVLPGPLGMPTAEGLVSLLIRASQERPLADPGRWEPDYLRVTGAERLANRAHDS